MEENRQYLAQTIRHVALSREDWEDETHPPTLESIIQAMWVLVEAYALMKESFPVGTASANGYEGLYVYWRDSSTRILTLMIECNLSAHLYWRDGREDCMEPTTPQRLAEKLDWYSQTVRQREQGERIAQLVKELEAESDPISEGIRAEVDALDWPA